MKINPLVIFCVFIIFLVTNTSFSQSPYIYNLPNAAHFLKLHKKGDLAFSVGAISENGNSSSFLTGSPGIVYFYDYKKNTTNLQLAYSPLNRLSISFNHGSIQTKTKDGSRKFHQSHIYGVGLGIYHIMKFHNGILIKRMGGQKEIRESRDLLMDLHIGYNKGKISNRYFTFSSSVVDLSIRKYYLQGGFHYIGKYIDFSYSLKGGSVNYLKGIINGKTDLTDQQTLTSITEVSNFVIWENTFRMEFKFRQFGFFSQITLFSNEEFSEEQWTTNIGHIGFSVKFKDMNLIKSSKKKKRKKKKKKKKKQSTLENSNYRTHKVDLQNQGK